MSEVQNSPNGQRQETAPANPALRKCFSNPLVVFLVVTVFIMAAIFNWNEQRRTANFGSDITQFESALQDYVRAGLEHGVTCFDYARGNKGYDFAIGQPDLQNENAETRTMLDAAATRLRSAVASLSANNRPIAVNRVNTVIDEANDKLSLRPRVERPGVFTIPFQDRRLYLVQQAQENGADLNIKVGPNAPWETRSLASVVFAVGWRSALAALIADGVVGIAFSVLTYCWVFFLNRIRELGRAARGLP